MYAGPTPAEKSCDTEVQVEPHETDWTDLYGAVDPGLDALIRTLSISEGG